MEEYSVRKYLTGEALGVAQSCKPIALPFWARWSRCQPAWSRMALFVVWPVGANSASLGGGGLRKHLRILAVLGLAVLCMVGSDAFAAGVCNSTPDLGDHIDCQEGSASTSDINIDAVGIDIDLTGGNTPAVNALHQGSADVSIRIAGETTGMTTTASTIDTMGFQVPGFGVSGRILGGGALTITLQDTEITTQDPSSHGLFGEVRGNGGLTVDLRTGVTIDTRGEGADGMILKLQNYGTGEAGNIILEADGISVMTAGDRAKGMRVYRESGLGTGPGDVRMTIRDSMVVTGGDNEAHAIYGYMQGGDDGVSNIIIDVDDSSITTNGHTSYGIYGQRQIGGDGRMSIDVDSGSITTNGYTSYGIYGRHHMIASFINATGDLTITTRNHRIETTGTAHHPSLQGTFSYGIFGEHQNTGNIDIDLGQGSSITTAGDYSHGIVGYHDGEADTRRIDITVSGPITVNGAGAQGVRVGTVSDGAPARMAALDAQGYRRQTVTVNDAITSTAEGVYLAGGGRVIIGSEGSIASGSGIAILATGTVPEDSSDMNNVIPAIPPRLRVDLNPSGQRMTGADGWLATALGGGWILNDGGGTTIAVNDVVLHEAQTGVVANAVARNGAWDVTMRAPGRTVTDRTTDPWTIAARAVGVIADRDFNAEDFAEAAGQCPEGQVGTRPNCTTPPPMCPAGQVGTRPNCRVPPPPEPEPEPEPPVLIEEYAPRAALYEVLPGFLLHMAERGPLNSRLASSETPVWVAFSGGSGSVDPGRSTTDAAYDYDRFMMQIGKHLALGEGLEGSFAVHYTQGDSDVSSPTDGGDIDARGAGAALDIQWQHGSGYYLGGRASFTAYDVDLSSDRIGRLASSVDALGVSFSLETGMRLSMGEAFHLAPRAWLSHSGMDIDGFTDTVNARASFSKVSHLRGGIGAFAETVHSWNGGVLASHGALDIEQMLDSRSTRVNVSGEDLKTRVASTRLLLGLGSRYRKGNFSISVQLSADGPGTDDEEYSGQISIGVRL